MSSQTRYPSDLTDAQWALVEPLLSGLKPGGRRFAHPLREVVNAILYLLRTGCAWRQLPKDFPPWETVYWHFRRWRDDGSLDLLHDALRDRVRERERRDSAPSAGIVDAQSVKGADTVGRDSRGYDAGKKINGRKRHLVVDTIGMLVVVLVTAASVQDRDGAQPTLAAAHRRFASIRLIWADGGYAGQLVTWARQNLRVAVEIVRKPKGMRTFEVLPRRWVVERTISWLVRCRRLDHDYERLPATSVAIVKWAMIGLMVRRLEPSGSRRAWSSQ